MKSYKVKQSRTWASEAWRHYSQALCTTILSLLIYLHECKHGRNVRSEYQFSLMSMLGYCYMYNYSSDVLITLGNT